MIVLTWAQKRASLLRQLASLDPTAAKTVVGIQDRWLEADQVAPSVALKPQPQPQVVAPRGTEAMHVPDAAPQVPEPPQREESAIEVPVAPETFDIEVAAPAVEAESPKSLASYLDD